jgi:SsrA-binding protein
LSQTQAVSIRNRRARHEYFVEETLEAGLSLCGTEVKSIRLGKANLNDSFAMVRGREVFVVGFHISPYEKGNQFNHDPLRDKKLLLHSSEIRKLQVQVSRQGFSLIPLAVYFKGNRLKVELGVCRGKKLYDKRETLKERDDERDIERAFRQKQRTNKNIDE